MRKLQNNNAVSNILSYAFTFAIASMLVTSVVVVTNNVIDNKINEVAEIEARNLANYISNAIVEAASIKQAVSESEYQKQIIIPLKLAGKDYFIDVLDDKVVVKTYDGKVSVSSSTYNTNDLGIGVAQTKISGSVGEIIVKADKNDYVYKIDFVAGDKDIHSPVEAGFYKVNNITAASGSFDFGPYKLPIKVENPSSKELVDMPVKIVLNNSNFDYSNCYVSPVESSVDSEDLEDPFTGLGTARSRENTELAYFNAKAFQTDLKVVEEIDPGSSGLIADITLVETNWYLHWKYTEADIVIKINSIGTYDVNDVIPTELSLNGVVKCKNYFVQGSDGFVSFNALDVLENIGTLINNNPYKVFLTGYLEDSGQVYYFTSAEKWIVLKYGDIYVNINGGADYTKIQDAIDAANPYQTIYVHAGVYEELLTINGKSINLTGEYNNVGEYDVEIKSSSVPGLAGIITLTGNFQDFNLIYFKVHSAFSGNEYSQSNGIVLDGCSGASIIKCDFSYNNGNGIKIINGANNNNLIGVRSYSNHGNMEADFYKYYGDGLHISGSTTNNNIVRDSYFYDQSSRKGDGIDIYQAQYNYFYNCISENNYGYNGNGLIIRNGASYNEFYNCKFLSNTGQSSDGIELKSETGDSQHVQYNKFYNCEVAYTSGQHSDGIAIWVDIEEINPQRYPCNNDFYNCDIHHNDGAGVALWSVKKNNFYNCIVNNNCIGFWNMQSNENLIYNCTIHSNHNGLGKDPFFKKTETNGDGIHFDIGSAYNEVYYCKIYNNEGDGINLENRLNLEGETIGNKIKYNSIYQNGCSTCPSKRHGIFLWRNKETEIYYNNIYENAANGIYICHGLATDYVENNKIKYNNIFSNLNDGIHIIGSAYRNDITYNNIYCNGGGVYNPDTSKGVGVYINGTYPRLNRIEKNNFAYQAFKYQSYYYEAGVSHNPDLNKNIWSDNWWNSYRTTSGSLLPPHNGNPGWNTEYRTAGSTSGSNRDTTPLGPTTHEKYRVPDVIWVSNANPSTWYDTQYYKTQDGKVNWHYHTKYIQDAINNSIPGGTIYILSNGASNPYEIDTALQIDKTLKLIGIPGTSSASPIIKMTVPGQNALNITKMNYNGLDTHGYYGGNPDYTIYIDNIQFQTTGKNNGGYGIYIDEDLFDSEIPVGFSETEYVKISNCTLRNNVVGIHCEQQKVIIENCNIYDNDIGINLIKNPIAPTGPSYCVITNCIIHGNNKGLELGTGTSNNNVYNNIFGYHYFKPKILQPRNNYDYDANDSGASNIWHNGYPENLGGAQGNSGGNLWQKYDDSFDTPPAYDYKKGAGQNVLGRDYIVDSPYTQNGVNDQYPLTRKTTNYLPAPSEGSSSYIYIQLPFMIDYWNPYGESVIYVKLSMDAYSEKKLGIYFGAGQQALTEKKIFDLTEFYDDFEGTSLDTNKWVLSVPAPTLGDYGVILNKDRYIISKNTLLSFQINFPDPTPQDNKHEVTEEAYLIEAKIKLNNVEKNEANMILMKQIMDPPCLYMINISKNNILGNSMNFSKIVGGAPSTKDSEDIDFYINDNWLRLRSNVYISKHCMRVTEPVVNEEWNYIADISSYLYDFYSYSLKGKVDFFDYSSLSSAIYTSGTIGLACGFNDNSISSNANAEVDWIRILKIPINEPIVTIGALESKKIFWSPTTQVSAYQSPSDNPYIPQPSLQDYHQGSSGEFIISGLEPGEYSISINKGIYDDTVSSPSMDITVQYDIIDYDLTRQEIKTVELSFSETNNKVFEMKYCSFKKETTSDVKIIFSSQVFTVNSIIIERGYKGIKVVQK